MLGAYPQGTQSGRNSSGCRPLTGFLYPHHIGRIFGQSQASPVPPRKCSWSLPSSVIGTSGLYSATRAAPTNRLGRAGAFAFAGGGVPRGAGATAGGFPVAGVAGGGVPRGACAAAGT